MTRLGLSDPRVAIPEAAKVVHNDILNIATNLLLGLNRLNNEGRVATNIPAVQLPPNYEKEIVNHRDDWLKSLGDSNMSQQWKRAIFGNPPSSPASVCNCLKAFFSFLFALNITSNFHYHDFLSYIVLLFWFQKMQLGIH